VQRTTIPLASGHEISEGQPAIAISPDGTQVVYRVAPEGRAALFTRTLQGPAWQPLGNIAGGPPFFSPDGKWVAFYGGGRLRKVPASGGSPTSLAEATNSRGGTWSEDGTIYFAPTPSSGLWRVSAGGGEARELTRPDRKAGENSHRWPQMLPGGTHLLMTVRTSNIASFDDARIAVLSLENGTWRTVLEGATFARYVPTGHLVFVRGQALYALPFDLKTLTATGTPVRVVDGLSARDEMGSAQYSFSARGSLIYLESSRPAGSESASIISFDASGAVEVLGTSPREVFTTRMSPDGRFIAARVSAANDDISIFDVTRRTFTRLTFEDGDEWDPVWSADGRSVFYTWSPSDADHRLAVRPADGSGEPRILARGTRPIIPASVSPDGRWVACVVIGEETGGDVVLISTADGTQQTLVKTPFNEFSPRISPNGKWIVYGSLESGRTEVYVRSLRPGGGRWLVSSETGREPRWMPDGKSIVYSTPARRIYRVSVEDRGESLEIGRPEQLAATPRLSDFFEVAPDGSFIGAVTAADGAGATSIQYVENWFADLERRVPKP
jgi:Tol biopolymer transport system component